MTEAELNSRKRKGVLEWPEKGWIKVARRNPNTGAVTPVFK